MGMRARQSKHTICVWIEGNDDDDYVYFVIRCSHFLLCRAPAIVFSVGLRFDYIAATVRVGCVFYIEKVLRDVSSTARGKMNYYIFRN